jgi:hypothetical protein
MVSGLNRSSGEMATLVFCDIEEAIAAVATAPSEVALMCLIDRVDDQFEASMLDINPKQWGILASAVGVRLAQLRKRK